MAHHFFLTPPALTVKETVANLPSTICYDYQVRLFNSDQSLLTRNRTKGFRGSNNPESWKRLPTRGQCFILSSKLISCFFFFLFFFFFFLKNKQIKEEVNRYLSGLKLIRYRFTMLQWWFSGLKQLEKKATLEEGVKCVGLRTCVC